LVIIFVSIWGGIMTSAAMNIHVQVFMWACFHFFRIHTPDRVELFVNVVSWHLPFKKNYQNVFPERLHYYVFPPVLVERFLFLHIFTKISIFCFDLSPFGVYEILTPCSLVYISLVTIDAKHLFMCVLTINMLSFIQCNIEFWVLFIFWIQVLYQTHDLQLLSPNTWHVFWFS
jgi:hypothetical protein